MKQFTPRELAGYRGRVTLAINLSKDGAYAEIDLKTARMLLVILDQLAHCEEQKP